MTHFPLFPREYLADLQPSSQTPLFSKRRKTSWLDLISIGRSTAMCTPTCTAALHPTAGLVLEPSFP